MIEREREGVRWLEFELLNEAGGVKHGVFLRHGGCSQGAFNSLNMSLSGGDDQAAVYQNRKKVTDCLGLPKLFGCHQVHSHRVIPAGEKLEQADGLMTETKEKGLMIQHADCQVALFYDPIKKVVANVHSGWRGSVANIYAHAVEAMKKHYSSQPDNLLVAISPSLGPENAEFINYRTELPEHFWAYQIRPTYFDFWTISRMQLHACGIKEHHIQIAEMDTYAEVDHFFSYRRDRLTGRHATVIALTE